MTICAQSKTSSVKNGMRRNKSFRLFLADSIAMLTFFTVSGVLNERFIAGMEWSEVLASRVIGAPLMILTARAYGVWRDSIMALLREPKRQGINALFLDTFASLSFNVPIYGAIIAMGGASFDEVIKGCMGVSVVLVFAGRPYGLWLDFVRKKTGAIV